MRVLHVLSQRPAHTGSGVTLDAVVRRAAAQGWSQRAAVGVPVDDPSPAVGGLNAVDIHPLLFGKPPLDFALPGMSDVMPYPSTRFADLDQRQLATYRHAWAEHLRPILADFQPHLIHSHHLWLVSAMLKDLACQTPVVTQCHATGFRQMDLCPHLAEQVRTGCARNERFLVPHEDDAERLQSRLRVERKRVIVVGAGYNEDIFDASGRPSSVDPAVLYVGKLSRAKGLNQLLDAFKIMQRKRPGLVLHVAGSGSGSQAHELRARMATMAPYVRQHGHVDHGQLAELMRLSAVCVLPSFYEGLPLVLVEATACGCRLVATALPGIKRELAPALGEGLELVPLPDMIDVDEPRPEHLPLFVERMAAAIEHALDAPPLGNVEPTVLEPFTWRAVFDRIERVWRQLTRGEEV